MPGLDSIDPLILHSYSLGGDHVSKDPNLIIMELTLLWIGKKAVFPKVLKDSSNGFDVALAWVFGIDQDVVQVHNDNYIELFRLGSYKCSPRSWPKRWRDREA